MGSVINNTQPLRLKRSRWSIKKTKLAILAFYAFAVPAYLAFGLQPSQQSAAETFAAESENATGFLIINSINLSTSVAGVSLSGHTLLVPDYIAGSFSVNANKTLLVGHSSTVFENLKNVKLGDVVDYNDHSYRIVNSEVRAKEKISMNKILEAADVDTLVLMTCSGESLGNNDYTHRLVITAEAVD